MMEITKTIDHQLYPRKAIAEARQAYREFLDFSVAPLSSDKAELTITVKEVHQNESKRIILEFFNFALDRSSQIQFESE